MNQKRLLLTENTKHLQELIKDDQLVYVYRYGCPSTAIGVEELANIGVKTMVRLGTSGAMQEHTRVGDLVIANGAVRQEGTS